MQPSGYLTFFGICVASATALVIAYWQRKQMRQIELFKVNPEVGLKPPPSPVWEFTKRHVFKLLVAFLIVDIATNLFSAGPPTRTTVFFTAFDFSALAVFTTLWMIGRLINIIAKAVGEGITSALSKQQ